MAGHREEGRHTGAATASPDSVSHVVVCNPCYDSAGNLYRNITRACVGQLAADGGTVKTTFTRSHFVVVVVVVNTGEQRSD